ncbi:MAG: hypothetical protein DMD36_06465 [Gemmatimonadetes bacterium]|nr:MAG: hypothetical protein DMD36_06465 [Gemmatimonadota bacterium]
MRGRRGRRLASRCLVSRHRRIAGRSPRCRGTKPARPPPPRRRRDPDRGPRSLERRGPHRRAPAHAGREGDGGRRHLRRVPAVPLPPGLRREAGEAALCPLRRDVASGLDGDLLRRDIRPQTLEIVIILTVNMLMISRSGVSSLTSDV